MIEFKAECGHTVRAKDEETGGVVRCTYCGKDVAVPDARGQDLDFLFSDVDKPAEPGRKRRKPRRRFFARRHRTPTQADPFSVVLRMCYAAALLTILILVGKEFVLPLFEEGGIAKRFAGSLEKGAKQTSAATPTTEKTADPSGRPSRSRAFKGGLLAGGDRTGLFVSSVPNGAQVFWMPELDAPTTGTIRDTPGCLRAQADGEWLKLADDTYVVEVSLPWTDKRLNDKSLSEYERYLDFRRGIHHAPEHVRSRRISQFFMPDEADGVFVHETLDQIYLVRQYREVIVREGRTKGVRALFLPRIIPPGKDDWTIEPIVAHYVPPNAKYGFDKESVRGELEFWEVPATDHLFVVEMLERIGVVPYATSSGETRLFMIGIRNGEFTTRAVDETSN